MKDEKDNDLQDRLAQAIQQMKEDHGEDFDISNVYVGVLHRRTGISRGKLRKLKRDGFKVKPHGNKGRKATNTILSGFTGTLDLMLANGITNSTVCFERLICKKRGICDHLINCFAVPEQSYKLWCFK